MDADEAPSNRDGWRRPSPLRWRRASRMAGIAVVVPVLGIAWDIGRSVVANVVGRVDPAAVEHVARAAADVEDVKEVRDIRVRRARHGMQVRLHVGIDRGMPSTQADAIGVLVRERIHRALTEVVGVDVHLHRVRWDDPPDDEVADHRFGADDPLGAR